MNKQKPMSMSVDKIDIVEDTNTDLSYENQDFEDNNEDDVFEIENNFNKKTDTVIDTEIKPFRSDSSSYSCDNSSYHHRSSIENLKNMQNDSTENLRKSLAVTTQIKSLRNRFSLRTECIKTHMHRYYEEGDDDDFLNSETETVSTNNAGQSKLAKHLSDLVSNKEKKNSLQGAAVSNKELVKTYLLNKLKGLTRPIKEQGLAYLLWLAILSFFYLYNLISIPLRFAFNYNFGVNPNYYLNDNSTTQTTSTIGSYENWLITDYIADLIYLIDILAVKIRIKYISDGLWITDYKSMSLNYFKSFNFLYDVVSLLPLDLIQIAVGWNPLTRVNRLIKIRSLWEFFDRWDKYVQTIVFVVRFIKLFIYLLIINHFYACVYYKFSQWEINSNFVFNAWVDTTQNGTINEYVYSFLFALKLASTIGNNPVPETKEEYLFTAITYIISIFIFALIVDQIRGIVRSLTKKQDDYLIRLARTNTYLNNLGVTDDIKNKIKSWFDYNSNGNETGIDLDTLSFMPINIQMDIAINVHFDMLSKVHLFQNCDKNLLYSLVLRIKPVLFMPSDYICKKGDVGREMYIVDKGIVEVFVNGKAVVQMKKGSVFGEISLLAVGGGNRRTADVISKGFSTLYVLHKNDLNEVLRDYPEVEKLLRKKAKKLLNKGESEMKLKVEPIITDKNNQARPRLIDTILSLARDKKITDMLLKPNQLKNLQTETVPADFYQLNDELVSESEKEFNNSDDMKIEFKGKEPAIQNENPRVGIINELNQLKSLKKILFQHNRVQSFDFISAEKDSRPYSLKLKAHKTPHIDTIEE